jgi:hypothetical protein
LPFAHFLVGRVDRNDKIVEQGTIIDRVSATKALFKKHGFRGMCPADRAHLLARLLMHVML